MSDTYSYVPKPRKRKKSGGSKKHGRNLVKCAKYRAEGRREKNKARRIAKEARRQERLRLRRLQKELNNIE
jgi:hypothetical protein